jgi:predicted transcriptional regulator
VGAKDKAVGKRPFQVVNTGDAALIGLLSDEERARVFSYLLSHLAAYDDEIAPAVGLPHERVISILDMFETAGLVEIGKSLKRDPRVVELTERGIRIARALRHLPR